MSFTARSTIAIGRERWAVSLTREAREGSEMRLCAGAVLTFSWLWLCCSLMKPWEEKPFKAKEKAWHVFLSILLIFFQADNSRLLNSDPFHLWHGADCERFLGFTCRTGWVFYIFSSRFLEDTPWPRCTCWRIHTFCTRRNALLSTACTSHTEEVRGRRYPRKHSNTQKFKHLIKYSLI